VNTKRECEDHKVCKLAVVRTNNSDGMRIEKVLQNTNSKPENSHLEPSMTTKELVSIL
jgi:hypothetical protein